MIINRREADRAEERPTSAVREDELASRHRFANNLQRVLALIARESANARDPEVKAVLERLAVGVQQLTQSHETIEEVEVGH